MESTQKKVGIFEKIKRYATKTIWEKDISTMGIKGKAIAFLRVLITTVGGIFGKRVLVQASSLSYATLLAIGPMLAIVIMFAGMFFRENKNAVYEKIMDAATFVMPAFNQIQQNADGQSSGINPEIVGFIDNISKAGAKAGAIGMLAMLATCLLLCVNAENAFNFIWGIKKGRGWINRIVFYFSMIFFGSVGMIFGMTFFTTSQMPKFLGDLPFVAQYLTGYASWITYILGLGIITCVLAAFYKFIPPTRVKWKPAFVGAIVIMCLLVLNNKGSFLYISYIAKQQSFYGYLAIVAVAMFSLYIFWTMILVGCLITYSVQYVDFLSDDDAWNKMGDRAKKICALAAFVEIERSFYAGAAHSPTIETLLGALKMPKSAVIASVDWLAEKELVCEAGDGKDSDNIYFKPAVDPEHITVAQFFAKLGKNDGDDDIIAHICARENPVCSVLKSYEGFSASDGSKNLKQILA